MAFTFVLRDKSKQKHAFYTPVRNHKIVVQMHLMIFFHIHFLLTFCEIGKIIPIDNFEVLLLRATKAECFIFLLLVNDINLSATKLCNPFKDTGFFIPSAFLQIIPDIRRRCFCPFFKISRASDLFFLSPIDKFLKPCYNSFNI